MLAAHHISSVLAFVRANAGRLALLALVIVAVAKMSDTFFEDDNFRVVSPVLFRAGQLRSDEWSESYGEHRYKSVLNLRGQNAERDWYKLERDFADKHALAHFDFGISDKVEPSVATMTRMVALMRDAPKPLLIHCQAGADRSGLAAALYLYAVEGRPIEEARRQLSLWYGHFPWLISETGAMDKALERYAAATKAAPSS